MPVDTATVFLTSVGDLDIHRVMFQSQASFDEFPLLHLLHEHRITIVRSSDQMSLFVASSETSLSDIVSFLRSSMSETGEMFDTLSNSTLTRPFSDLQVRRRFYAGWAKLTTKDEFLRIFHCSCPPVAKWFYTWEFGPEPNALLTLFMNNVFDEAGNVPPSRATLSFYMRQLDGRRLGVSEEDLPPVDRTRKSYPERGTVIMLRGTRLPPLQRDDSTPLTVSGDRQGLYRWSFA